MRVQVHMKYTRNLYTWYQVCIYHRRSDSELLPRKKKEGTARRIKAISTTANRPTYVLHRCDFPTRRDITELYLTPPHSTSLHGTAPQPHHSAPPLSASSSVSVFGFVSDPRSRFCFRSRFGFRLNYFRSESVSVAESVPTSVPTPVPVSFSVSNAVSGSIPF